MISKMQTTKIKLADDETLIINNYCLSCLAYSQSNNFEKAKMHAWEVISYSTLLRR